MDYNILAPNEPNPGLKPYQNLKATKSQTQTPQICGHNQKFPNLVPHPALEYTS